MKIQYINKETHMVMDEKEYIFKENEIKEVPDRLGKYLLMKYKASFQKPVFQKEIKDVIEEPENIIVYEKKAESKKFTQLPSSKDVKYKKN